MNSASIVWLRRLVSPVKWNRFLKCVPIISSIPIPGGINSLLLVMFSHLCGSSPNKDDCPEFHNRSWRLWYSSLRYSLKVLMDSKCFRCNRSSSNHVGSSFNRPNENVFWYVESKISAPIARNNKEGIECFKIVYFTSWNITASRININKYVFLLSQGMATVISTLISTNPENSLSGTNLNVWSGFMKYQNSM